MNHSILNRFKSSVKKHTPNILYLIKHNKDYFNNLLVILSQTLLVCCFIKCKKYIMWEKVQTL